jgi:sterol desaturase/sphingolipid hydroxylase (fatty acid hydroxylase superfamily)
MDPRSPVPNTGRMLSSIVRYGYVPMMMLGIGGAAVALARAPWAELWMAALILIAILLSFVAERLIPYAVEWNEPLDDAGRDLAHAFVNETSFLLVVLVIPAMSVLSPFHQWRPSAWPFVLQVLFAVVVADMGITLVHMASHKVGWLWRLHAVHHSIKRFYGFNGLMKHPVHGGIELAAGTVPLLVLGLPMSVAQALAVCVAVQLLLQHSNADYRVGRLRYLLALNEGHRFHHLKWAGVGDVNFGLFTLVWDHALRTFAFDQERRFRSDDLGMAAKPNYPVQYLAQLAEPFRVSGACQFADVRAEQSLEKLSDQVPVIAPTHDRGPTGAATTERKHHDDHPRPRQGAGTNASGICARVALTRRGTHQIPVQNSRRRCAVDCTYRCQGSACESVAQQREPRHRGDLRQPPGIAGS